MLVGELLAAVTAGLDLCFAYSKATIAKDVKRNGASPYDCHRRIAYHLFLLIAYHRLYR